VSLINTSAEQQLISVQNIGNHLRPQNLTSFAVCLFLVANRVLFVQKCEKLGFRVRAKVNVSC